MIEGKAELNTASNEVVALENGKKYTLTEEKTLAMDEIQPREI